LVILPLSLLLPALYLTRRRGEPYPFWMDNLYLSIFAFDLAGNLFDLYNSYRHFDLLPHAHGTGAATVLLAWLLRKPMLSAVGLATVLHVGLEAQEYYSDLLFGLANVRGTWDVVKRVEAAAGHRSRLPARNGARQPLLCRTGLAAV